MYPITTALFALAGLAKALPQPQNNMLPGGNVIPTGDICDTWYSEHDHPDPHQLYSFEQLTDTLNCNEASCEISRAKTEGESVSASASISGDGWISAGFEVSKYTEKTQTFTCQGVEGDRMCVYWRQSYTMYGVSAHYLDAQCQESDVQDTTITSPNESKGFEALCAKNEQCGSLGTKYWNNMEGANGGSTWASGPVDWPFGDETGLQNVI